MTDITRIQSEDVVIKDKGYHFVFHNDWHVSPETYELLRFFKSTLCYVGAVGRFCVGLDELGPEDLVWSDKLSGAVNVYYALFHLGVACLDLVREYRFKLLEEFTDIDGKNLDPPISLKRLTRYTHWDVMNTLHNSPSSYLSEIGSNLKRWKDFRELFSYGPWTLLWSIDPATSDKQIQGFRSAPVFFKGDLEIMRRPQPFIPLKTELDLLVPAVESLLNEYPSFLKSVIQRSNCTVEAVKAAMMPALCYGPGIFAHNIPLRVFNETMDRLTAFLKNLGDGYQNWAKDISRVWASHDYRRNLESGSIFQVDAKSPTVRCPVCGSWFSESQTACPNCGAVRWTWT